MSKQTFVIPCILLALMIAVGAQAEALPVSKCLTATAKARKVTAEALMAKDIKAYEGNAKAEKAIGAYREAMEIAWEAMEEPYCGFGPYGTASAVKSYGKSVDRARLAFLENVRALSRLKVAIKSSDTEVVSTPTAVRTVKPKLGLTVRVNAGLRRGMKADAVLHLQQVLAAHFKLSEDGLATGFFGPKTEGLVRRFQLEKKVIDSDDAPGAGLVGPKTSAALNAL